MVLVPGQTPAPGLDAVQLYAKMEKKLQDSGYTVYKVNVPGLDLVAESERIKETVQRVTACIDVESVAVVAHSYGGLSARRYLKLLGGTDVVDSYIAIGTPQYGSPGGCVQLPGLGFDGCVFTPFMSELNAGDDTPGSTEYYSIRGAEETADGRLDGGQCRFTSIPNVNHILEPEDDRVTVAVEAALQGKCEGRFVDDPDNAFTWQQTIFPGPN